MTPKKKTATSTTLKMERKLIQIENTPATTSNGNTNSNGATMTPGRKESLHIAGGKNAGIVVNKEIEKDGKKSHLIKEIAFEDGYSYWNNFSHIN